MTKLLERAMAEASALPDTIQDQIGSELLAHIEKLSRFRADLDAGLRSLDAGAGRELDIEALIPSPIDQNP